MMKLNAQGLVYGFVFDQDDFASTVIGEFDSLSARASTSGSVYYINLKDGTSYDITDAVKVANREATLFVNLERVSRFNDLNVKGSTVKIGYDAAGEIMAVYVFSPITIIDDFKPVDPGETIDKLKDITGIFTTYSTNGSGRKADLSGQGIAAYIVTWDAQNGYAKNVDAVEEGKLDTKQVATKGADLLGNYITFEADGPYYFAEGAEGYYEDIEVGDYVKYAFYESQNANHIYYLKVVEGPEVPEEPEAKVTLSIEGNETPVGPVTFVKIKAEVENLEGAAQFTITYDVANETRTTDKIAIGEATNNIVKNEAYIVSVYDANGNLLQIFEGVEL
jgi:hypothetical protein